MKKKWKPLSFMCWSLICSPAYAPWFGRLLLRPPEERPIRVWILAASLPGPQYERCGGLNSPCHCLYYFISTLLWATSSHFHSLPPFVAMMYNLTMFSSEYCIQHYPNLGHSFLKFKLLRSFGTVTGLLPNLPSPLCLELLTFSCLFMKNTMWIYTGTGRKWFWCQQLSVIWITEGFKAIINSLILNKVMYQSNKSYLSNAFL